MARNFQATERCGCGASITVESYTHSGLREALQEFREMHIHIDSPPSVPWSTWGFNANFDSDGLPWAMPDEEE